MTLEGPFEGTNSNRVYHLIIDENYSSEPIKGNYSEELKQIVYKTLEKNQYERIHMMTFFKILFLLLLIYKGFDVLQNLK
jgi:hypothetical protein